MKIRRLIMLLAGGLIACAPLTDRAVEATAWEARARVVTITRDDWGIAHIAAKTDADAVFGLVYAQAEDDFNRIEMNYLGALGRLAEAGGEEAIHRDLRQKLFVGRVRVDPSWSHRARGGRSMGERTTDGKAGRSAHAVVAAYEGDRLRLVPRDHGAPQQLVR
jgi:acyl-homoserine-lactone acylase